MLTLRFESDALGSEQGDTSFVMSARSFRAVQKSGIIDVMVENENGVEIDYPIANEVGAWRRMFVMNEAGKTVARYAL